MSSFIDGEAGLISLISFVLALVLSSKNNVIITKQAIWVQCGVSLINRRIVCVFTDAC